MKRIMSLNKCNFLDRTPQEFFKKQIWRIDDVASVLGVSKGHIYNLVSQAKTMRRGGIPHHKKGKLLFFIPDEILSWIQEGNSNG